MQDAESPTSYARQVESNVIGGSPEEIDEDDYVLSSITDLSKVSKNQPTSEAALFPNENSPKNDLSSNAMRSSSKEKSGEDDRMVILPNERMTCKVECIELKCADANSAAVVSSSTDVVQNVTKGRKKTRKPPPPVITLSGTPMKERLRPRKETGNVPAYGRKIKQETLTMATTTSEAVVDGKDVVKKRGRPRKRLKIGQDQLTAKDTEVAIVPSTRSTTRTPEDSQVPNAGSGSSNDVGESTVTNGAEDNSSTNEEEPLSGAASSNGTTKTSNGCSSAAAVDSFGARETCLQLPSSLQLPDQTEAACQCGARRMPAAPFNTKGISSATTKTRGRKKANAANTTAEIPVEMSARNNCESSSSIVLGISRAPDLTHQVIPTTAVATAPPVPTAPLSISAQFMADNHHVFPPSATTTTTANERIRVITNFVCPMCDRHMHNTEPSYVVIRFPTCGQCCCRIDVREANEDENIGKP